MAPQWQKCMLRSGGTDCLGVHHIKQTQYKLAALWYGFHAALSSQLHMGHSDDKPRRTLSAFKNVFPLSRASFEPQYESQINLFAEEKAVILTGCQRPLQLPIERRGRPWIWGPASEVHSPVPVGTLLCQAVHWTVRVLHRAVERFNVPCGNGLTRYWFILRHKNKQQEQQKLLFCSWWQIDLRFRVVRRKMFP